MSFSNPCMHVEAIVENHPDCDISSRHFLSRDEALIDGFKKSVAYAKIVNEKREKGEELQFLEGHFLMRCARDSL